MPRDGVPTISAVVPAYNAEPWIAGAIDSVLAQTVPVDEIVVVDDGSTDGTRAILDGYGDRIRIVSQENRGMTGAANRCWQEARCDYVARCDADDRWLPDRVERHRATLAVHPEIDLLFGQGRFFGLENGPFPGPRGATGVLRSETMLSELLSHNVIPHSSVLVRRALYERLGGYRLGLRHTEDYDAWFRAARLGASFYFDPELVVRLGAHGANPSRRRAEVLEWTQRVRLLHHHHVPSRRHARRILARRWNELGHLRLDVGDRAGARRAFRTAFGCRPHPKTLTWVLMLALPVDGRKPRRVWRRLTFAGVD